MVFSFSISCWRERGLLYVWKAAAFLACVCECGGDGREGACARVCEYGGGEGRCFWILLGALDARAGDRFEEEGDWDLALFAFDAEVE